MRRRGYDPKKEGVAKRAEDPTRDTSNVSQNEIKGLVTTRPGVIADWITAGRDDHRMSVIFGTYQSAGKVAQALKETGAGVHVLVCDEAHRTASLRAEENAKAEEDAQLLPSSPCATIRRCSRPGFRV